MREGGKAVRREGGKEGPRTRWPLLERPGRRRDEARAPERGGIGKERPRTQWPSLTPGGRRNGARARSGPSRGILRGYVGATRGAGAPRFSHVPPAICRWGPGSTYGSSLGHLLSLGQKHQRQRPRQIRRRGSRRRLGNGLRRADCRRAETCAGSPTITTKWR